MVGDKGMPICLSDFAAGDEIRVLPHCGYGFHVACIDTWLESHSSCPSCRQILRVTRCQKCGRFPAIGAEATAVTVNEQELKYAEDNNVGANSNNNCSGGVNSSSNNSGNHSHSVNSGFLP
ncbi:unnamed protein product [Lathyrus sativus]|nr:unnamed protein product [Lathyrus sativus]